MAVGKVRVDGNSLVVTIPRDVAAKAHFDEGTPIQVDAVEDGEVRIQALVPRTRPDFAKLMAQVADEDRELLDRLAKYDENKGK